METGIFSVSLSVSNLSASKEFYEKLGFKTFSGSLDIEYLFMKKGNSVLRLFQDGIINGSYLTLNPDWDEDFKTKSKLEDFSDIKAAFIKQGIQIEEENSLQEPDGNSFLILDPDGNKILIEQRGL